MEVGCYQGKRTFWSSSQFQLEHYATVYFMLSRGEKHKLFSIHVKINQNNGHWQPPTCDMASCPNREWEEVICIHEHFSVWIKKFAKPNPNGKLFSIVLFRPDIYRSSLLKANGCWKEWITPANTKTYFFYKYADLIMLKRTIMGNFC